MAKRDPRATYEAGRARRKADAAAEDGRSRAIGTARLLVALGLIALFVGIAWLHLPRTAWLGVMGLVAAFAALASEGKPDPSRFLKWAEGEAPLNLPGVLRAAALLVSSAVVGGMVLASTTEAPSIVWLGPAMVALLFMGLTARSVGRV